MTQPFENALAGRSLAALLTLDRPTRSSFGMLRAAPSTPGWGYSVHPPDGDGYNTAFATGPADLALFRRATLMGSLVLQDALSVNRVEAFGQGALRWAKRPERVTAIGSLVMQWLGRDPTELRALNHDMWGPAANGEFEPGDAGWNWLGLETANPGIGAKIAAVTGAASANDTQGNVGLGRDALCELIKGAENTAIGYKALSSMYEGNDNTALGRDAGLLRVFGLRNTHLGFAAGMNAQEGDRNLFAGAFAGQDLIAGTANYFLTPYAGSTTSGAWSRVNGVLMLGNNSGEGITPADNSFLVHRGSAPRPLLWGDLSKGLLYRQALAIHSNRSVTAHTATTAETTVRSMQVQAATIGPNGWMDLRGRLKLTGAGDKIIRVRMGGIGGQIVAQFHAGDGITALAWHTRMTAMNSENAQEADTMIWAIDGIGSGVSFGLVDGLTADMSADRTLVVTVELSNAADSATLSACTVETMWMP